MKGLPVSYRATIARQPESLRDSIDTASADLEHIDASPLNTGLIGITGIGASFAAATVVAGEFQRIGRRAQAIRAVDLMQGGDMADSIIAMSAGGRSIEPVSAIQAHQDCTSFGITKEGNNPLSSVVGAHIHFASGSDATPSSTGYTGTLVAAGLLADKVAGRASADWATLPALAADVLKTAGDRMEAAAAIFKHRRAIDCVGAGSSFGTADGTSLLIREAARIPAGPSDTLHYLHGPMEPMDATTGVVIIGDAREIKLAQDLAAIGSGVLLITTEDVADTENLVVIRVPAQISRIARAILDILPAQLLAATLSDTAGLTDTKFRYRQTDTKIKAE
jgi:glutamine---fructose-6-phosphate transaminase (isomerizing)